MARIVRRGKAGLLLEAEVAPRGRTRFEKRYKAATRRSVSPGHPVHYQIQPNKWGSELRVYFNDPGMAASLDAIGVYVEHRKSGYRAGAYRYRTNDGDFWWKLVKNGGMRLGLN